MKDLAYWLRLKHSPNLGLSTLYNLVNHFGNAEAVCKASHSALSSLKLDSQCIEYLTSEIPGEQITTDLTWHEQTGNHILCYNDTDYPQQLKTISNPPPILYVKGCVSCLQDIQLAMVGSRNASPNGLETAHNFAKHMASSGLTITSGLALGIDAASHQGALAANGITIGVMATGLDQIYPAKHKDLANHILEKGALITEFPIGTKPRPERFPQRNRIISGLSMGTLVVEAALRSGSLITARLAMEQAREVFAIPGSIHNPMARGCHMLIKQGAKLVETAQDILEELAPQLQSRLKLEEEKADINQDNGLDDDYTKLLETMGYDPIHIDQLVERSEFSTDIIASMLLILELKGLININPDGTYTRSMKSN